MVKSTVISRYTYEQLENIAKTQDAFILGEYEKLTCKSNINFLCSCGNSYHRVYSTILKIGLTCKDCTMKNMVIKTKLHCIDKFGCVDPNQLPEIKQKIKKIFTEKYGVDSPMKSDKVKQRQKDIIMTKYGVENTFQSEIIKDKLKQTNILKYGVEHPLQNTELQNKFKQTMRERFGVEVPYFSEALKLKGKETCLQKYGVEYSLQNEEVRQKGKETCLQKYGVEYPQQNIEVIAKRQQNAKKYKKYTMPSGKVINIQGYEHFAIKELLLNYTEDEIKTNRFDIPRIEYCIDTKKRYYFPDIFIPKENKIIEVKSDWTYRSKTDYITEKAQATKDKGYNYEIWVYTNKGQKTVI
jgi:hypothetical protein